MSKEVAKRGGLTEKGKMAAFLDAQGMTVQEICAKTGYRPDSLSRLRGTDDYKAEKGRHLAETRHLLEPLVLQLQKGLLDLSETVLEKLKEALEAEIDGEPLWSVRLKAIDLWGKHPALTGMLDPATARESVAAQRPAVILFNVTSDGQVIRAGDGEPAIVDAEFEEVEEDEPGAVAEAGDDHADD